MNELVALLIVGAALLVALLILAMGVCIVLARLYKYSELRFWRRSRHETICRWRGCHQFRSKHGVVWCLGCGLILRGLR
jgi:hypothetical protein